MTVSTQTHKQLFSVKEVSEMVGLSPATIYRQVKLGTFPSPIKIGPSTRWRRSDLEDLFGGPIQ